MRTDDSTADLQAGRLDAGPGADLGQDAYDPEQGMRPSRHSFVRLRVGDPYEEDSVYAEPPTLSTRGAPHRMLIENDQLNLTVSLLHLARLLQGERAPRTSAAACAAIAAGVGDVEDVRDAIEVVLALRDPRLDRLLGAGAALSAYLRGLHLYCEGIVETFEEALAGLATLEGGAVRFRLAAAAQFYFDGLMHAVRFDLARAGGAAEAPAAVEELFFAATFLHRRVQRGF